MKLVINSSKSVFNITSGEPKPDGRGYGTGRSARRRGQIDWNKWLIENRASMKPVDYGLLYGTPAPWPPVDNSHPEKWRRPFKQWPHIEKFPTMSPDVGIWPPIRSIDEWPDSRADIAPNYELHDKLTHFQFDLHPTPPPFVAAAPTSNLVQKVVGCTVAGIVGLIILAAALSGAKRSRRGVVLGAAAVLQDIPSAAYVPEGPGPLDDDLPPPYSECVASSTNKYDSDKPPPYTYPQDAEPHVNRQQQNAFIETERRAECGAMINSTNHSEDAPGNKTELVFDSGRVVERRSLDLNSNDNETEGAGDANVQEQTPRHVAFEDRVVYVDETDKLIM